MPSIVHSLPRIPVIRTPCRHICYLLLSPLSVYATDVLYTVDGAETAFSKCWTDWNESNITFHAEHRGEDVLAEISHQDIAAWQIDAAENGAFHTTHSHLYPGIRACLSLRAGVIGLSDVDEDADKVVRLQMTLQNDSELDLASTLRSLLVQKHVVRTRYSSYGSRA